MKIVLVGASKDRQKYGNIILRDLINKGHEVFPINPKETDIEGVKCYCGLSDIIDKNVEVINIVTPPKITLEILKQANSLNLKNIWCQPGSSNEFVENYLEENGFKYITNACIMIQKIN